MLRVEVERGNASERASQHRHPEGVTIHPKKKSCEDKCRAWSSANATFARKIARGLRAANQQGCRLAKLLAEQPALAGIYEMKEKLCALLRHKEQSKKACRRHILQLLELIDTLKARGLEAACTLAKSLSDWTEEITRMWRVSRNNGITEGFHRKMKLIQRRAYGFRSFDNYRLRVIAQCG